MIHLIALQIAADASLDTVWQRWRLANRQKKMCSTDVDQTISVKSTLQEAIAALPTDIELSPSSAGLCRYPTRAHTNTHSTGGTA